MRSFLKHTGVIVAFLAGLLAILFLLSFVVNPKDNSAQAGMKDPTAMGFLGEPANSIDVLVLGDSESYSSIIPIQLWQQQGITSYVCGSHAQRLCYSEELMKRAFDCQSPKVVILETNALYRKISFAYSLRHSLEQFMPVFRYHNRWKSLTLRDFDFTVNYNHMEVNKGYWYRSSVKSASTSKYMKPSDKTEQVSAKNRRYAERIAQFCADHGAQLVLLSTPSTKNWNAKRHNGVAKLAEELGVEYMDLNMLREQVPIDWKTDSKDQGRPPELQRRPEGHRLPGRLPGGPRASWLTTGATPPMTAGTSARSSLTAWSGTTRPNGRRRSGKNRRNNQNNWHKPKKKPR